MKRFWVFVFEVGGEGGGMRDFYKSYATLKVAKKEGQIYACKTLFIKSVRWQVWDSLKCKIINEKELDVTDRNLEAIEATAYDCVEVATV